MLPQGPGEAKHFRALYGEPGAAVPAALRGPILAFPVASGHALGQSAEGALRVPAKGEAPLRVRSDAPEASGRRPIRTSAPPRATAEGC